MTTFVLFYDKTYSIASYILPDTIVRTSLFLNNNFKEVGLIKSDHFKMVYDSYHQPKRCTLKRKGFNCTFQLHILDIRLNEEDSLFYSNNYSMNISECRDNIIFINVYDFLNGCNSTSTTSTTKTTITTTTITKPTKTTATTTANDSNSK